MPLSEHGYCVVITFKMTEQVEQKICIQYCVKLEHSSTETIQMIQKATGRGNWWLEASSPECATHASCLMAEFFGETSNYLYRPDLVPCNFWLFPKLKSPLKGGRFQIIDEIQKIWWGNWCQLGELCEVPRCLLWRGLSGPCPMYNVFCILYLLQ